MGEIHITSGPDAVVLPFEDLEVRDYQLERLFERFGHVSLISEGIHASGSGWLATDDLTRRSELVVDVLVPPDAPGLLRWVGDELRPQGELDLRYTLEGPLANSNMSVSSEGFCLTSPWVYEGLCLGSFTLSYHFGDNEDLVTLPRLSLDSDDPEREGAWLPQLVFDDLRFSVDRLAIDGRASTSPLSRSLLAAAPLDGLLPTEPALLDGLLGFLDQSAGTLSVSGQLPYAPWGDVSGRALELSVDLNDENDAALRGQLTWAEDALAARDVELRYRGRGMFIDLGLDLALDLSEETLRLESRGRADNPSGILGTLGMSVPLFGSLSWDLRAEGPWSSIAGQASCQGSKLRWGTRELGELSARLSFDEHTVTVAEATATGPLGSASLAGRIQLDEEQQAREIQISALDTSVNHLRDWFPDLGVDARLELRGHDIALDLAAPLESFRGAISAVAVNARVFEEPIGRVSAEISRHAKGPLRLERIRLTRGEDTLLKGELELDLKRDQVAGAIELLSTALRDIPFASRIPFPAEARITTSLALDGRLSDPSVGGEILLQDWHVTPVDEVAFGRRSSSLRVDGRLLSGLRLASDDLYEGLRLDPQSRIDINSGRYDLFLEAKELRPLELVKDRESLPASALMTGTFRVSGDTQAKGGATLSVLGHIPPRGLRLDVVDEQFAIWNEEETVFGVSPAGLFLRPLKLVGRGLELALCGDLGGDGGLDLEASLHARVDAIPFLRESLTDRGGEIFTEGDAHQGGCLGGRGITVRGSFQEPRVAGALVLQEVSARPRGFQDTIRFEGRSRLLLETDREPEPSRARGGRPVSVQRLRIDPEAPMKGSVDEGRFTLQGEAIVAGLSLEAVDLQLQGANIAYRIPGVAEFTANPKLSFTARPDQEEPYRLAGEVRLVSGLFHKDFDEVRQMLSGLVTERHAGYSRPLDELLPWLKELRFDVRLLSNSFDVRSRLPFGQADLSLNLDLRLGGTWDAIELYDRVDIVPGSMVTYQIVGRDFEVTRGVIDFSGDMSRPRLDVRAKSDIDYIVSSGTLSTTGTSLTDVEREETVTLMLALQGVPPDLGFELSSNRSEFDQEDLQYLLITGAPRQGDDRGNLLGGVSLNLLTENLVRSLSNFFLAPFLDRVSLGFSAEGGVNADLMTRLGRRLQLRTRILQEGTDMRYSAGFTLKVSDSLSLDGRMKVIDTDVYQSRTYEAKMRYRVGID